MRTAFLVLFLLTAILPSKSQNKLTGKITDSHTKEPLIGAHVTVTPGDKIALTDRKGRFMISGLTVGSYNIAISHIGFTTRNESVEVKANESNFVDIEMDPGNVLLSDVFVSANTDRPINTLSQVDINLRTINTSQDVLRMVPGLFIAQHAGGGKAEQIFLRGFDIDHGTDINLQVDGMPVNMVSHAHGQGYSDLHFVIPELISYVDFDTGPYYADKGDFTTAGYASFFTKNILERNLVKAEGGQFGMARTVAAVNLLSPAGSRKSSVYIAGEFFRADGYFESPQDFHRLNLQSKFNTRINDRNYLRISASFFDSKWDASGQVPQRAVDRGLITRYGSIDDSEGGNTQRSNFSINHSYLIPSGGSIDQQLYAIQYNFDLFSNFTFYLDDPVNGDEIRQQESRMVYGYHASYTKPHTIGSKASQFEIGGGFRFDDVNDISLSRAVKREFIEYTKRGDLNEGNINLYAGEHVTLNDKWNIHAGVRLDHFQFRYQDHLIPSDRTVNTTTVNPKFSVNYRWNNDVTLYVRTGTGFHSNDARVAVEEDGRQILPRAYGVDLGADIKLIDNLFVHAALWRLDLDQEFVYVGDEGVVEPSGKTRREGIDVSLRYQVLPWLFIDSDVNVTKARSKEDPEGENYIPLAPLFSTVGGITVKREKGFNGSVHYRYIGDRPANETNSVVAEGYFIADLLLNYTTRRYEVGVSIQNLFNTEWNEAQFDTESQLINETGPVSEIHFTPGTPFFAKLQVSFFF